MDRRKEGILPGEEEEQDGQDELNFGYLPAEVEKVLEEQEREDLESRRNKMKRKKKRKRKRA